jgi:serine/threonine-protein kinase
MPDTIQQLGFALSDRYRIARELGAGGMATVYLAHDLKHDRDVAIKVLHPELAAALGGDRFLSEIKTTAKLQHPHILPLLDSGDADGLLYYVMPYVEGETLRSRLSRERQLPIDDALRVAREVADALGSAHAHGIIHRDIKPENILLQGGHALVADFGIALAVQSAGGARMTQTGLSLGTPQYMSPEQAMGERVIDARADIYALGAVLYEMLTGDPPFSGNSVQAIIAKVMSERPVSPHVLRDTVPPHIEAAVLKALAKIPADRPANASEFAASLAQSTTQATSYALLAVGGGNTARRWQIVAAVATVVAIASLVLYARRPAPSAPVVRFKLPAAATAVGSTTQPAVSPDGRVVAYSDLAAAGGITVRWIDRDAPELIPGTERSRDIAFSPDGQSLAFTTEANELRTIGVDGRSAATLAKNVDNTGGVSWGTDGYIYFHEGAQSGPIKRVSPNGGAVETVVEVAKNSVTPAGEGGMVAPLMLDDGRTIIYAITTNGRKDGDIIAMNLGTKVHTHLAKGLRPIAFRDGWLLIVSADGTLRAQRFDVSKSVLEGAAVTLLTGVYTQDSQAFVAVGRNGTMIYQAATSAVSRVVWVSRDGLESEMDSSLARSFTTLALSPAGDRIAIGIDEGNAKGAVWVYDLSRRTFTRVSRAGDFAFRPQWAPDGRHVLFSGDGGDTSGVRSLWSVGLDGSDSATLIVASKRHAQEVSWPAGGRYLAFRDGFDDATTRRDIHYMAIGERTSHPIVATNADEENPAASPDGRWLAYASDASGRMEVYLTPFPAGGARLQVSVDGGTSPVWARNGRQLYFRATNGKIITTAIDGGAAKPVGAQRTLFDASRYTYDPNGQSFDVALRDDRFLFIKPPPRASVDVVLNWWNEAQAKLAKVRR